MLRNGEQWDLGEPELNDRGQPVIHNIAKKLGCIRPNSDIDLPVHSVFPEDEQGLAELATQLEAQQQTEKAAAGASAEHDTRTDRASSSDGDHSDFEDYRKIAFGSSNQQAGSTTTLSPASLTYDSFDAYSAPSSESLPSTTSPTTNTMPTNFSAFIRPQSIGAFPSSHFLSSSNAFAGLDMFNQGLVESEFGTIKPHVLDCPNPEVMLGMGDPMIYSGFDADMRL